MKNTERLYQHIANSEGSSLITIDGKPYGVLGATINYEPRGSIELEVMDAIVPQWNGTGLPPVGTVCQCTNERFEWLTGTIVYHGKTQGCRVAVMQCEDDILIGAFDEFRPIRTPEQIAADQRENELNRMVATVAMLDKGWARKFCEGLYDAGYRKQSTKQDDQQ